MLLDDDEWWAGAQQLARRAGAGDEQAAPDLAGMIRPWVYRLASNQFPYHGDADDVAQNVSLTVLGSISGLREPTRLRSWLVAVTLNEVRRFYRQQTRHSQKLAEAASGRPPSLEAPERTSVLGGHRVDLLDAMARMPPHKAFALGLRQLELGYEEIAAEMSRPERLKELFDHRQEPVPVGSVKRWVSEARRELRRLMDEREVGDSS